MGRPVTCDIKTKTKKTQYLSEETLSLMEQCHIEVEHSLGKHVEVTPFVNELIAVGAEHIDEITNKFRGKDRKQL